MINGVSDYLLWPIRTLEQAQQDIERWRRSGLFDMPSSKRCDGVKSRESMGALQRLSQDARSELPAPRMGENPEAPRDTSAELLR